MYVGLEGVRVCSVGVACELMRAGSAAFPSAKEVAVTGRLGLYVAAPPANATPDV